MPLVLSRRDSQKACLMERLIGVVSKDCFAGLLTYFFFSFITAWAAASRAIGTR